MANRKGSKSFKSGSRARRRRFFDNESKVFATIEKKIMGGKR